MEPDIRMLDKYKSELKDMDRNISLLQSKLHGVGEHAHLPLPEANINTYFSLRTKCWLRGGVGEHFPRNV